jgi:hypothetical protein
MATGQGDGSIILSTKVDTKGIKQGTNSIIAMARKAGSALAVAFSVKKIADFVKASVDAFAEYEQLVGGVETLFKGSSKKLIEYANEAYRTTGQSANEYMRNVTAFSASLLSAVGGDTERAAEVANAAMISISDNVNKLGSSAESVQMAFQGFAKQQYMLLDNLKLGYGGTKTEMERLLKDAQAITGVEYNIDNLADVYTAIGVIQEKLGIAGTTAKEAATTISGSAAMTKAAWNNVLTAISGGGDIDAAIDNFVYSAGKYFDNILPVVIRALEGIGVFLEQAAPKLAEEVGQAIIKSIPRLIFAIERMIIGEFRGIFQGIVALFTKTTNAVIEKEAEKVDDAVDAQKEFTEEVENTNKELKKSLAGFDEIQILSSKSNENMETLSDVNGGGEKSEAYEPNGNPYAEEVNATISEIVAVIGTGLAMIAIGLILLFTGNIGAGIGFAVLGGIMLGVGMGTASKTTVGKDVIRMVTSIMAVASGALLALGIILLWIGGVVAKGVAIGMIVAGGALLVSSITSQAVLSPNDIGAWLAIILGIAGGALLALGIILCMVGSTPIGVGMIIAGSIGLVSTVALNFNVVIQQIKGWVANIMAIVGASLLVIGIILTATGHYMVGIPMILAGAAALVTPVALNWNALVDKIRQIGKAISDIFAAVWSGIVIGFKSMVNGIISLANLWIDGLNLLLAPLRAIVYGVAKAFGSNITFKSTKIPHIPKLAQGAVIPPNREFLAVLGDQKQGTNIEAPLQTIVDAFNIALAQNGGASGGNTEVVLEIDGREFGRAVVEQGNRENRRIGTRLVIA